MIYVIQIILLCVIAVICFGKKFEKISVKKNQILFLFIVFSVFILIMGLRDVSVGVDTNTYSKHYSNILNSSWKDIFLGNVASNTMEIGWNVWMKLCTYVSPYYLFFQIIYAIVYCWFSARFISKTSNVFVSTVLFLGLGMFTGAFNIQRQYLAVIWLGNSYLAYREKKIKETVIYFLGAVLVHKLSICFILVYVIYALKDKEKLVKALPIVGIIVALNYKLIIALATVFVPAYHNYYTNEKAAPQTASGVWIIWGIIICISLYGIYSKKIRNQEYKIICIFSLGYVLCNIIGLQFNYFERIGLYFVSLLLLVFADFGLYLKRIYSENIGRIYYTGLVGCYIVYYLLSCFTESALKYSFIW